MTAPLDEIKLKLQREIFREQSFVEPLNTDRWVANNRTQSLLYAIPARRVAAACCSRIASVKTSNPGMLRFCLSSMKPSRLKLSMSAAFWFRNEPPPNSLISRRCSGLVNSSQGIPGIMMLPVILTRRLTRGRLNYELRRERPPDSYCQHLFCLKRQSGALDETDAIQS